MRKLGRLPLPKDDRDFPLRRILGDVYATTRKFWTRPLILDQGNTGTCTANAWTAWLADGPIKHPDITALNDPISGEKYARQLYIEGTGDDTLQKGAYTRQILNVLLKRHLIGAYYKADTVNDIIECILSKGPVVMGSNWYASMYEPRDVYGNSYLRVDEGSNLEGGHEYVLDAVNLAPDTGPPYVRLHNSWGKDWGHGGTARISLNDLEVLFVGDAFVCTELR